MLIGAGPYRFVAFTPGVELVLEAFEHYWRKVPAVTRLVFKASPTSRHGSRCSSAVSGRSLRAVTMAAGAVRHDRVRADRASRDARDRVATALAVFPYEAPTS